MSESIIIVCDDCGKPAVTTITVKFETTTGVKDVCQRHLDLAFDNTRKPVRGRRRGVFAA